MAIRATLYLALLPSARRTTVHDLAEKTGLPQPYLAKIIQRLTSAGLVRAFRGPGGGIQLAPAPHSISIGSIVRAIDGVPRTRWCVLGFHGCSDDTPCPFHRRWAPLRAQMERLLEETTLDALTRRVRHSSELKSWTGLHAQAESPQRRAKAKVQRRRP